MNVPLLFVGGGYVLLGSRSYSGLPRQSWSWSGFLRQCCSYSCIPREIPDWRIIPHGYWHMNGSISRKSESEL